MSHENILDQQVNRWGFWSVIIFIITSALSMYLPLDIVNGYAAAHLDRVAWLQENRGLFIVGWVNQIVAMLTLSGAFAATAWVAAGRNTFCGILGAFFVAMATMAFVIPKFIAVWTIPMLANAAASGAAGSEMAHSLLPLLNVSIPFSLYTSFDYLGFWLYAVFALLVTGPLYGEGLSARIASFSLGAFGVIYHLCLIALLAGGIEPSDIESYFLSTTLLLFFHLLAMCVVFRSAKLNDIDANS